MDEAKLLEDLTKAYKVVEGLDVSELYRDSYDGCLEPCCFEHYKVLKKLNKAVLKVYKKHGITTGSYLTKAPDVGNYATLDALYSDLCRWHKQSTCEHTFAEPPLPPANSISSVDIGYMYMTCTKCNLRDFKAPVKFNYRTRTFL